MLHPAATVPDLAEWIAWRRPTPSFFGPAAGLEAGQAEMLEALLARDVPLVVDADGLTLLAARPAPSRPDDVAARWC